MLSAEQLRAFEADGYLLVRGFYDTEREIEPIQRGIHALIGLLIQKYRLPIHQEVFRPDRFDSGYQELIAANRAYGGEVYDAVKQIPAFVRLVCSLKHDAAFKQLRGTDLPGVAAGGYGIRIDNPFEERFRANWHQDYPSNLRSINGLIFWSPLVEVTEALGPVTLCVGSHRGGVRPCYTRDPARPEKTGAYGVRLVDEEAVVGAYPRVAPQTRPCDLLILDYLTLHASGFNRSTRSRWSMQMRYFDFNDPTGQRLAWKGGFNDRSDLKRLLPGVFIDPESPDPG
jgi:hypothetical protein